MPPLVKVERKLGRVVVRRESKFESALHILGIRNGPGTRIWLEADGERFDAWNGDVGQEDGGRNVWLDIHRYSPTAASVVVIGKPFGGKP